MLCNCEQLSPICGPDSSKYHNILKFLGCLIFGNWLYGVEAAAVYRQYPHAIQYMSPVSLVFQTKETMSIGLKNKLRVGTSIP